MALMPVGPSKFIRRTIEIKHNGVKNPNWTGGKPVGYLQALSSIWTRGYREQIRIQLAVRVEIRHFLRCSRAATVKKCTKKHDARAKLLFCLLNLLRFFPFLLTSPLSLLKLFTITVGYILHHIVLGLNVFSVRSFTQREGVFCCILFLKWPWLRLF